MVDWVAKKYLPFSFFDDNETQEFFNYLNPKAEVPMRTQLNSMVEDRFNKLKERVTEIFQNNSSKISFTLDGWSSVAHRGYNGITGHFIDNDWTLHSVVVDFCPSYGAHSGKDIAKCFHDTVTNYGIQDKVLGITVDNAAVNTTFMFELSRLMVFDHENQHFRCIPHVLNISVQSMLQVLGLDIVNGEDRNADDDEDENQEEADGNDGENGDAEDGADQILFDIETSQSVSSPLTRLRSLFKLLKNSEQWRNKLKTCCDLCEIEMLSPNIDVTTRWNSTCDMIRLAIRMQRPITTLTQSNPALQKLIISEQEWILLQGIHKYLRHFQVLSSAFSGEKYPTLNLVVVGFNMLLDKMENSIEKLQKKSRKTSVEKNMLAALNEGLAKLLKHYSKSNWIYCIVLLLDPRHKLETFAKTSWGKEMEATSLGKFKEIFRSEYCTSSLVIITYWIPINAYV